MSRCIPAQLLLRFAIVSLNQIASSIEEEGAMLISNNSQLCFLCANSMNCRRRRRTLPFCSPGYGRLLVTHLQLSSTTTHSVRHLLLPESMYGAHAIVCENVNCTPLLHAKSEHSTMALRLGMKKNFIVPRVRTCERFELEAQEKIAANSIKNN
jgi:hypothetical protein